MRQFKQSTAMTLSEARKRLARPCGQTTTMRRFAVVFAISFAILLTVVLTVALAVALAVVVAETHPPFPTARKGAKGFPQDDREEDSSWTNKRKDDTTRDKAVAVG